MKKFIAAAAAILFCGAMLVSCNSLDETGITVTPTQLDFGRTADTKTVSIKAKGSWTIEKSRYGEWFTVSKESGKGNATVKVSVSDINEVAEYESYFEVIGEEGAATVIVTQGIK